MDSGAIDSAVIGLLQADATLHSLLPDGVYFDAAPQGAKRFAIVSVLDETDEPMFQGGRAFEHVEYFVKAVIFSTSGSDARKAATQIDAVLHNAALAPVGYRIARCQRSQYRRYSEPDVNPDQKWQHDGGQYFVDAVPIEP